MDWVVSRMPDIMMSINGVNFMMSINGGTSATIDSIVVSKQILRDLCLN